MITPGSVHYLLINIDCHSKVILLLKLQILLDPDRIPLTYVLVTFTDYRSAFSPTVFTAAQRTAFFENNDQMGIPHATVLKLQEEGITRPDDLVDFDKDMIKQIADNLRHPAG